MAETNVADALVEYLSSRGVENIFGVLAHTSFARLAMPSRNART